MCECNKRNYLLVCSPCTVIYFRGNHSASGQHSSVKCQHHDQFTTIRTAVMKYFLTIYTYKKTKNNTARQNSRSNKEIDAFALYGVLPNNTTASIKLQATISRTSSNQNRTFASYSSHTEPRTFPF